MSERACDFCPDHDAAADTPIGPPCGAEATHAILWLDGSRRFSFGCAAHLVIDADATPHILVPLAKETR